MYSSHKVHKMYAQWGCHVCLTLCMFHYKTISMDSDEIQYCEGVRFQCNPYFTDSFMM